LSQKKIRWEPVGEVPSKGTSTSGVEPEPTHVGSEEDEGSEIPLRPRSRRTTGPAAVTVEELSEEIVEKQVTRDKLVRTPVPIRIAPQAFFWVKGKVLTPRIINQVPQLR